MSQRLESVIKSGEAQRTEPERAWGREKFGRPLVFTGREADSVGNSYPSVACGKKLEVGPGEDGSDGVDEFPHSKHPHVSIRLSYMHGEVNAR